MAIRKTLTSTVLAGALALGTAGCSKEHSQYYKEHSQYNYDGKIGEDQVTFSKIRYFNHYVYLADNILTVTKPDGRVIKYVDSINKNRDLNEGILHLSLEYVEITKNGQTTRYSVDEYDVGGPIMKEAQKKFDAYIQQITEIKVNQGLENLK